MLCLAHLHAYHLYSVAGLDALARKGLLTHIHYPEKVKGTRQFSKSHGDSLHYGLKYLLEGDGDISLGVNDILMLFDGDMFLTRSMDLHYQMQGAEVLRVLKFVRRWQTPIETNR